MPLDERVVAKDLPRGNKYPRWALDDIFVVLAAVWHALPRERVTKHVQTSEKEGKWTRKHSIKVLDAFDAAGCLSWENAVLLPGPSCIILERYIMANWQNWQWQGLNLTRDDAHMAVLHGMRAFAEAERPSHAEWCGQSPSIPPALPNERIPEEFSSAPREARAERDRDQAGQAAPQTQPTAKQDVRASQWRSSSSSSSWGAWRSGWWRSGSLSDNQEQ